MQEVHLCSDLLNPDRFSQVPEKLDWTLKENDPLLQKMILLIPKELSNKGEYVNMWINSVLEIWNSVRSIASVMIEREKRWKLENVKIFNLRFIFQKCSLKHNVILHDVYFMKGLEIKYVRNTARGWEIFDP